MYRRSTLLLGLVVTLGMTGQLRADQLDLVVKKNAPELIKLLKEQKINTLGVLRFRIQEGEQKPSFSVSALNGDLSGLVENALILSNPTKEPIVLVRDIAGVANKAGIGDWFTETGEREKLFGLSYPTAWGKDVKKVDGFLTGTLKVSKDLKQATLIVELVTAKEPAKLQKLAEFEFKSDTGLMTDLGRGFNLKSRKDEVRPRSAEAWTEKVMEQSGMLGDTSTLKDLKDLGGVDFSIFADNEDITATVKRAEESSQNQWAMPSPGEKRIFFRLTNNTPNKLGVLLKLNDQNVLQLNVENQKIFLEPKKSNLKVTGFVREVNGRQQTAEFKSLVGEAATRARNALGVKEGYITVSVFESLNDDSVDELPVTDRALNEKTRTPPPEEAKTDLKSYQDVLAKRGLMKRSDDVNSRDIVPDEDAVKRVRVTTHSFPNPKPVASVTIRIVPK